MARLYCVVMVLLLLAEVARFGEGASNPGLVARITRKGLTYVHERVAAALQKELSAIEVPDFLGSFQVGWFGRVSYESNGLRIQSLELRNSDLSLRPGRGVRASLFNNYVSVSGNWKVTTAFVILNGTFGLSVDGISISVSLNLGKDPSGRPTASVAHCDSSIDGIDINISGPLSRIQNFFHGMMEIYFKNILEQKICEMVRMSTTSRLEPYLRTLPVTSMIDQVAGIDYSLVGAPQVTSQCLDTPFKGEFFGRSWHSPVPFDAPPIRLPQEHDRMIYFAVSDFVFNTASRVYHQAGRMKFIIQNEHLKSLTKLANNESAKKWRKQYLNSSCQTSKSTSLTATVSCFASSFLLLLLQIPLASSIALNTNSFRALIPQLAKLYPNMQLEFETSPESAPFLMFTPGNVTLLPVMDIQTFALPPNSSDRKPLFQLRVRTSISATIGVTSSRIIASLTSVSRLTLELKHSNVGFVNVQSMETILNYYAFHILYPSLNAKLEEGFPLPLSKDTSLNDLELQIHTVSGKGRLGGEF
ncbi:lipopolysaccharide-binding protein-like [Equus quagga]|uniref:lipopolysaccharide-binding protein-like n=1 Tax=Equus quagga TaxID=89248 RepID=UPI001EE1FB01|nr:lipopolysaccharide-binding protein-like [Equus quagga]